MTDATLTARTSRMPIYAPRLALLLAVVAVLLLALTPVAWRTGLLHFRTTFWWMMQPAAYIGIAAGLVSLISLFWWSSMAGGARIAVVIGLIAGALCFYVPYSWYQTLSAVPRIHDISTDTDNLPAFAATLAARQAEGGDMKPYSPEIAKQQRAAYPDLVPLKSALPPADAFKRALEAAQAMPGWTIVKSDAAAGTIEGSERSRFMGFTDDFIIRIAADGSGSRIDMRSESRQGLSDFGVNAKRIRAYLAALKPRLG
jgi:uncharacterized protein (DUF1499 family)